MSGGRRSFGSLQQCWAARPQITHQARQPLYPEPNVRPRAGHRHPLHQQPYDPGLLRWEQLVRDWFQLVQGVPRLASAKSESLAAAAQAIVPLCILTNPWCRVPP